MTLAVSGGRLLLDGVAAREVGVNAAYMLARRWYQSTDTQHVETLDLLASKGVKVIRCVAIPNAAGAGGGLGTWGTATGLSASFYTAQDAIFDYAETKGIQIIPVLFGNYWAIANYKSEKCNQLGVTASAMRAYMRTCADEYVAHYKTHAAVAAWEISNEWNNYAELSAYPSGNDYTGAAYRLDSANLITIANLVAALADVATTIKAQDSSRCVISGNAGPWYTTWAGLDGYEAVVQRINPDPIDTICVHIYSYAGNNVWCRYGYDTLDAILGRIKRVGEQVGKPLIVGELGVKSSLGTYEPDVQFMSSWLRAQSAAPLSLVWNVYKPGSTLPDSNTDYDIWTTLREEQLDIITEAVSTDGVDGMARVYLGAEPDGWMNCTGTQCAYVPVPTFGEAFTVSFWVKDDQSHNTSFPRIISATSNESTDGFTIVELPETNGQSPKEPYFRVFQGSGQSATLRMPGVQTGRWKHAAYVYTMFSKTFTANADSDFITLATDTQMSTGDPVVFTTTGTLPAGLSLATTYYVIKSSATVCALATSVQNALDGVEIDITDAGTGTHTVRCCALRNFVGGLKTLADYTSFTGTFVTPASGNFVIGASRTAGADFFKGQIAKVRLWQRGLSELEVWADFVGSTPSGATSYLVSGFDGLTTVGSPTWTTKAARTTATRTAATRTTETRGVRVIT